MMQLKIKYTMLVALILAFAGCDKLIYDQEPKGGINHKVYLSVNVRAAQPSSGLRSSINQDITYSEDRVQSLAMLIFKSDNGERVGLHVIENTLGSGEATRAFQVEMTPGQYDLYFVANLPDLQTALNEINIPNRAAMNTYLENADRMLSEALYLGASATEAFPMARVYLNQEITEGGTIYQPKPFKPKQLNSEERTVVVNASGNGEDERNYVELIRVVAKLEVNLEGVADVGVDKVYFRNANRHFRLVEFEGAPTAYYNDNLTNTTLRQLPGTNTYVYYMSEAIIGTTSWSGTGNNQPINYFTILTLDGKVYDIPIITYDGVTPIPAGDYLNFSTDGRADNMYSIFRNRHYVYTVRNLEKIEIGYQVDPWNVVERPTYMGYGYNVEVDKDGNVTITNTIDDCMPHKVYLVAVGGAYFDTDTSATTTIEYGYTSEDDPGYDEETAKAGYSEDFTLNSSFVTSGPYLEVYYNKVPGATGVTPDKVFTK